jgi:hypothetical protein
MTAGFRESGTLYFIKTQSMLKYLPLEGNPLMGRGAMAAQQTLNLFILVRIRAPQLEKR